MKSKPIHTEKEIVIKLQKGKIEAFEMLYNMYSKRLYYFGYKYLKSEIEAEGLVQDVFEKVWERRTSLRSDLSFKSYIFTIAFNFIKKSFIKRDQVQDYLSAGKGKEDIDLTTTKSVEYQSLVDYLNTLIEKLPEKRRLIFVKSRLEDLSIKEIAAQLEISPKTVENQLSAAIKFIRLNWKDDNITFSLFFVLFIMPPF